MPETTGNRVRERREARGMAQVALAAAANLSRQGLGAIEAGRATPSVDVALRLAQALDATVEELFGDPGAEPAVLTEPVGPPTSGRVALAQVGGRWVAYPLAGAAARASADGLARPTPDGRLEVEPVRPTSESRDNLVIMGCAPALGLLADRLSSRAGPGRFLWLPYSSTKALECLARRQAHVAGVHLVDGRTGAANVVDVRRHVGAEAVQVVTLARWEVGLLTAPGNPKRLHTAADLGRRGLRLVTREPGSGARRLLDRALREAGLPDLLARGSSLQATGHLEVAHVIALGAADVGLATADAALAFGLHFVPLTEERYDLVLPAALLGDVRLERLLDVMTSSAFGRELAALGYDVRSCGERVAEIPAA